MKVIKKIQDSELVYDVEKDDAIFCPNCGAKEVYVANGKGDYYEGPQHFCKNCNNSFTLPSCGVDNTIRFSENVS